MGKRLFATIAAGIFLIGTVLLIARKNDQNEDSIDLLSNAANLPYWARMLNQGSGGFSGFDAAVMLLYSAGKLYKIFLSEMPTTSAVSMAMRNCRASAQLKEVDDTTTSHTVVNFDVF
jgi:hypothetical protein